VALDRALALSANPFPLQIERVQLLRRSKGLEAGVASLQELVAHNPQQPVLMAMLAEWLNEAGRPEAAIQAARLALQEEQGQLSEEQRASLHIIIGLRMCRLGQLDQAIHHLSEAVDSAPANLEAYLELGRAYQERRADAVSGAPPSVSLARLMPPLFGLAIERGAQGDQTRENRAAIVVLALYATGQPLDRVVPAAAGWRKPAGRTVTLGGRDDFPKHFLVSAALAAEAGSPLADAIGVYKEVEDSRGGSGFSFNDIGADRAGVRFGEVASRSLPRARTLARALAAGVPESDFMPDVSDLPEFMPEAEFKRRFGGLDSPGYAKMIAKIDQRVDATPLLSR
jgi:tetratricopeptide (TPR) repeat protein